MSPAMWKWTCLVSHLLLSTTVSPLGKQQPLHPKRPFITFTGDQAEGNFNHLVVDERTGHIYLGAVNRIYKLSSDLKVLVTHQTGPDEDNPKCYPPRIVQTCNEPLTPTNNINKMLLIDYKENRLIACGSLYQGICKLLRLDDLFKLGEPFHKKEHYLSGVNESGSVFGVIVSYSNMDDKLFIATAVDGKPEYFPTISSRKLTKNSEADGMFAYVFHDEFVASMIKIPSDTFTIIPDFDIYYIYGFSSGNFVYFLTLQPEMISPPGSTTKEQVYTSKLVRLCKEDTAFNSYVEVPIGCEKNGVEYRLLQAAYLSKAGAILARSLDVGPEDDILFTVFSKGQKRKMKSLDESALCIFVLKKINDRIKDRLQSCYRGEGTLDLAWLKVKDIPCSSALLTIDDNFCGLDMNAPLGVSSMVRGLPIFTEDGDRMTSVIAYVYKNHSLAFVGTKSGKLKKNNFIKDFPQLADGLMVIPLPVEEQCRGVLSEPLPDLRLLTGDIKYDEAMGYPMVQHWRVRSNLYRVKLSSITLSAGFANILKILNKDSSREELLSFIQQFGSHYIAEALYGSEFSCTIHFPSKKVQQQLWLQYQKETTELGNKKELKSMPFITYLSGLLTAQMLSDDHLISGVEIHCEEKGRCPSTCHLCRRPGKEQLSPTPVLLEINRVVPLYALIQDNDTREAFKGALMSSYWCSGKGDVIEDWCRCDLNAFDENGLPNCSPLPPPVLRLSPNVEPSSTVVSLEWLDVQPAIGTKVSDYVLQHKKVDEYTDTDLYTGESLSFADDLLSGLATSCVAAGRSHGDVPETSLYSVIFKCLEPDGLYKFTLYAVDTRGRHSELSTVTLRTACPLVDDSKAEEIADKIYNLYNGYTSGKEQQTAYNTLMEVSASMLFRVQHHYNSHYEKFGDFVWRSEDELGPRKAHLILRRLEKVSSHCSTLLRSAYIQSRTETMPYLFCRSEEVRPPGMVWYSILKDTKVTCEEKMVSMLRNMYGESKGR